MDAKVVLTSQTTSAVIPVENHKIGDSPLTATLEFTGTATASIEGTIDNIFDATVTPVWVAIAAFSAKSANTLGVIDFPLRGVRLNVSAFTDGTVTMHVFGRSP